MPLVVDELITQVAVALDDPGYSQWKQLEHLEAVNRAVSLIVRAKPEYAVVHIPAHALVAGARQVIPADAVSIIDVKSATAGAELRAVTKTTVDALNAASPYWVAWASSASPQDWAPDPSDQRAFYVSPPRPVASPSTVAMDVYQPPAEAGFGDVFPLPLIWVPPVREYMLEAAWSKDAEYANDQARAARHRDFFLEAIK